MVTSGEFSESEFNSSVAVEGAGEYAALGRNAFPTVVVVGVGFLVVKKIRAWR